MDLFTPKSGDILREINPREAHRIVLEHHYAKRLPSISRAFGLIRNGELEGVCTFGVPPSWSMLEGVCGKEFSGVVWELNRLCLLANRKNDASRLVGYALRSIGDRIIVSYADTSQGHVGYVYQACNAIYTGLSVPHRDAYDKSAPHKHHASDRSIRRLTQDQLDDAGGEIGHRPRARKHRYVFITGGRRFKRRAKSALRWPTMDYPKGGYE